MHFPNRGPERQRYPIQYESVAYCVNLQITLHSLQQKKNKKWQK